MNKVIVIISFILLGFVSHIKAQNISMLNQLQDSIRFYAYKMTPNISAEIKKKANEKLIKLITKAARQEKSIEFGFDSLNIISVLTSEDKVLRIFTWVIPYDDGSYSYSGIVQAYSKSKKLYTITTLHDQTSRIIRPMKKTLSAEKWYGARYYQIITKKYHRKKYYTVLGWKGIDMVVSSKVIDVVDIKSNGRLVFGYGIFNLTDADYFGKNQHPKRVIYTFSSEVHMNLVYQQQTILKKIKDSRLKYSPIAIGFNAQKKEVRTKPKYKKIVGKMIVMDQIAATSPAMEGIYQFYIPKINVIDALYFERGKWKYYGDIDARNEGDSPTRKDNIDYDLIEE